MAGKYGLELIFDNVLFNVYFRLWSNEPHERCCQAIQVVPFAIQNAFRLKQEHTLVVPPLYTNKQIITPAQQTIKVGRELFSLYFLLLVCASTHDSYKLLNGQKKGGQKDRANGEL